MIRFIARLLFAGILLISCQKEDEPYPNTSQGNFDALWNDYDHNYAGFVVNAVNWDSLRQRYRPADGAATTDRELFDRFQRMILALKDGHASLSASGIGTVNYYRLAVARKPTNWLGWRATLDAYVTDVQNVAPNISYGRIGNDVAYMAIGSFADDAEDFLLMMRSLPNVRQVGDTTLGGVVTRPSTRTLPNGWSYRVPDALSHDLRRQPITGGIVPHVPVWISPADSIRGRDRILETAVELLR